MKSQRRVLVFLVCFIVILAAAPAEVPAPPGKRPRAESRAKQKQQPKSRAKGKKKPAKPASSASWLKKFAARFRSAPGSRSGQASVAAKPQNTSLSGLNPQKICGEKFPAPAVTGVKDFRQPKSLVELRQRQGANQQRDRRHSELDHVTAGQRSDLKIPPPPLRRGYSMNSVHPEVQAVLRTFANGRATPRVTQGETLYRYHGRPVGNAETTLKGSFLSNRKFTAREAAEKLGLKTLPKFCTEVRVAEGVLLWEGTAATLTPNVAGAYQAFIPRHRIDGGQVKFGNTESL